MNWPSTSRHARGYGTSWDKLRLAVLARDHHICHCPMCKGGADGGRVTPAGQVDHITPKSLGGTDDLSNLRAVNAQCHKRITLEQQGRKPGRRVGLDGFPVDKP